MNLRNASIEGREVTLCVISCRDAVKWRCLFTLESGHSTRIDEVRANSL
jgi:hypothetical protein